jgi:GT2 family glycosyltransferase
LAERIVFVPKRREASRRVEYIMGACFMMSRTAVEQIGQLDDRYFMYFEETDWCWRARQAGLDIWYCAETEITHLEGQAAEQASLFSLQQFQQSYRLFVAKNYGPRQVGFFRLAQFAEYGAKSLWRRLTPGAKNKALAAHFATKARLQLTNKLAVEPPA